MNGQVADTCLGAFRWVELTRISTADHICRMETVIISCRRTAIRGTGVLPHVVIARQRDRELIVAIISRTKNERAQPCDWWMYLTHVTLGHMRQGREYWLFCGNRRTSHRSLTRHLSDAASFFSLVVYSSRHSR